eukprot:6481880-Amphidinium_carterae.3
MHVNSFLVALYRRPILQLGQLPTALGRIGIPNLVQLGILARITALRTIERLPQADVHLRQACHVEQPFLLEHLGQWVSIPPQGLISSLDNHGVLQCQTLKDYAGPQDTVPFARCARDLDHSCYHALVCSKHLHTRRHNMLRDHIAAFARSAGLYTQIEQLMDPQLVQHALPNETQTTASTSSRRLVQGADIHIRPHWRGHFHRCSGHPCTQRLSAAAAFVTNRYSQSC